MRTAAAFAAALAAAAGIACSGAACADPSSQVGNGLGGDGSNGNHSVLVQTVNGVTTVVVDGKILTGDEAQPYIDAAKARRTR